MSDASLRALERRAIETQDAKDVVAFLAARLKVEGIHQPHPLLEDLSARRAWAEWLGDDPWGALFRAQLELMRDDLTASQRSRLTHTADTLLGAGRAAGWFDSLTASHVEERRPDKLHAQGWPADQWITCRRGTQELEIRQGRLSFAPRAVTAQAIVEGADWEAGVPPLFVHGLCRLDEVYDEQQLQRMAEDPASRHLEIDWKSWQQRERAELVERYGSEDWVGRLAACPSLGRVRTAQFELSYMGDEGRRTLFGSPHWGGMRSLVLNYRGGNSTPAPLEALVSNPACQKLSALGFARNCDQDGSSRLGDHGAQILASGSSLSSLERLSVPWCEIGPLGAVLIACSPGFASLRHLNLSENELGPRGLADLAAQEALSRLETLELSSVQGEGREIDDAIVALVTSSNMSVSRLDLAANELGPEVAAAIAGSPRMKSVRALRLGANALEDEGLEALCRSRNLTSLRELHLVQNEFTTDGYEALAGSSLLSRLEVLSLGDWGYDDEDWTRGLEAIVGSKRVGNLRVLRVAGVTVAGVEALAASRQLRNLNALDVEERDGEEDLEAMVQVLAGSPHLKRVTRVRIRDVPATTVAWRALQDRYPLSIQSDWD